MVLQSRSGLSAELTDPLTLDPRLLIVASVVGDYGTTSVRVLLLLPPPQKKGEEGRRIAGRW